MTSKIMATLIISLVAACSGRPMPDEQPMGAPPPAIEPAVGDAAAPATATTQPTVEEVAGDGTCQQDEDCVLTNYQEGCCVQACQSYASNKRDLAAARSKENCAARTRVCPPPAPCRRPTHRVVAAKCSAGACVAIREPIGP